MSLLLVMYRFTALINCLYWNITFCIRFLFIICCNRSCGLFKYSKNWLIDVNYAVFAKIPTDSSNVDQNIMTQVAGIKGSENIENKNVQTNFSIHEHKWTGREWFHGKICLQIVLSSSHETYASYRYWTQFLKVHAMNFFCSWINEYYSKRRKT